MADFHPPLPAEAAEQAQALIESFKAQLTKVADGVFRDLYCDILPFIESDAWGNFRNAVVAAYKDYTGRPTWMEHDFKEIRKAIFEENREEIVKDLKRDFMDEIDRLNSIIADLRTQSLRHY